MKKILPLNVTRAAATPGRRTVLAALIAGVCAPALAVTAAPADAGSTVVISQVYGGGGNSGATYKNDFIELFNRSASAVSIGGWSVQYGSSAGTTWQATAIPAGTTLQPGQYFLIKEAAGTGGSTELPASQVTGTLALSGTVGKVALVSSTTALTGANPSGGALQDLLGFGSANGYEGAAGPGLSNTTAALRLQAGCTDTNNNASDFVAGSVAPRNTSTTLNSCSAPAIVATCPANLAVSFGNGGSADLSATDVDGIVNNAVITSTAVPGISLVNFMAASANGGNSTVSLQVGSSVPVGSYTVGINFSNSEGQNASCAIAVGVQGETAVTYSIPQIQGSGNSAAHTGVQTTEGVVTLKVGTGFFIQDEAGDGDPTTSDGIFVYTGSAGNTAKVGDLVRVTGTVTEYTPTGATHSYTEISNVTGVFSHGGGHSITPTNVDLPNANLGQVEGMLVRFPRALTVSQLEYVGERGEVTLSSGRLEVPTNLYAPRTPEAAALAAANAQNMIVLDDGIFVTPTTIPYIGSGDGSLRAGDTVSNLTGVIDFGAIGGGGASFKLQPTEAPVFSQDNPRQPEPVVAAGNIRVASANVLNFFTTFTNGSNVAGQTGQGCTLGSSTSKSNCRGADSQAEFTRQMTKIVGELKAINADVFGLMEIQNSGDYTVSYLTDALNAAIGVPGTYVYVPKPAATGTDAIRVAMIYKPASLTPVGTALSDDNAVNNRPPMAQTFVTNSGAKFSLVVNHLKSKGSCPTGTGPDSDLGDSQSCWNATRIQQANQLINNFVPQVVAAGGTPNVLLIGDFNSYGHEDPINLITATGYVNELERFVRPNGMPYSFVFSGTSGYLDHALASPSLNGQMAGVVEWHNNADEPTVIDYNLDGKPQDLYTAAPFRASDHDPVVISLNLAPKFSNVTAGIKTTASGLTLNRATGKFTGTFSITNTGTSALTGPFQIEFDHLTAGITLSNASGTHAGAPYISAATSSLAPGATLTVPLTFDNPAKAGVSYSAQIYSGTF